MTFFNFIVNYDGAEFSISVPEVKVGTTESCVVTKEVGKDITKVTVEMKRNKDGTLVMTVRVTKGTKDGHKIIWEEVACPIVNKLCPKQPKYITYGTVPTEAEGREFKFEE